MSLYQNFFCKGWMTHHNLLIFLFLPSLNMLLKYLTLSVVIRFSLKTRKIICSSYSFVVYCHVKLKSLLPHYKLD